MNNKILKFIYILKDSVYSLQKNKRQSFLTIIGIIIGIASVITIVSIGRGLEKYAVDNLKSEQNGEVSYNITFIPNDLEDEENYFSEDVIPNIDKYNDIEKIEVINDKVDFFYDKVNIGKLTNYPQNIQLIKEKSEINLMAGKEFKSEQYSNSDRVAIIPDTLANASFHDYNEAINGSVVIDNNVFTIIGIYKDDSENNLYSLQSSIYLPEKYYYYFSDNLTIDSYLKVVLKKGTQSKSDLNMLVNKLNDNRYKNRGKYSLMDNEAFINGASSVISSITLVIGLIGGIALVISGIGIMNMMYTSVSERVKEIGIRKAIGATRNDIKLQFLLEGLILTLFGGIIGFIFGQFFAFFISFFLPFKASFDYFTIMLAVGISSTIGIVFSIIPASNASRKNTIDILKD